MKTKQIMNACDVDGICMEHRESHPTHTPTPWSVDAMGYIRGPNSENILENHANAEFTVRAVNAHEKLLEMLKAILESDFLYGKYIEDVKALIARAEGK